MNIRKRKSIVRNMLILVSVVVTILLLWEPCRAWVYSKRILFYIPDIPYYSQEELKGQITGFIDDLDDSNEKISELALLALRKTTKQDFGKDSTKWRLWWESNRTNWRYLVQGQKNE